jgi:hypothetical protein
MPGAQFLAPSFLSTPFICAFCLFVLSTHSLALHTCIHSHLHDMNETPTDRNLQYVAASVAQPLGDPPFVDKNWTTATFMVSSPLTGIFLTSPSCYCLRSSIFCLVSSLLFRFLVFVFRALNFYGCTSALCNTTYRSASVCLSVIKSFRILCWSPLISLIS